MTSSSDEDKQNQNANNADTVGRDKSNNSENNNNSNENKSTGLIASILDRATKSGFGRKKLNPNKVEAAVAKQMDQIHKSPEKIRLTVVGGGSFGTAMANLAARNGCDTTIWVRNKRTVKSMAKTQMNKKYLPGYKLDNRLKYSYDLESAVKDKDIIFLAVPSSAFRETLKNIKPFISGQSIVSLTKGMEKDTFALMSDIIKDELPEVNFGVMSGTNLAVEIMKNMPSATVIASESEPLRHAVQAALHSAFFRVFASDDIRGVELGGALKNIYAIAMGMAAAYDVGENTKAMLLTRSLAEMSRFAEAMGANPLTFLGLAGVGDLVVTCMSPLSRNYRVGYAIGSGQSLEESVDELGEVAEGVNTLRYVRRAASRHCEAQRVVGGFAGGKQ